ncbi:sensor domain-containing diguanylate cyclase [Erythrobacter crassostreae]|uniref:Diguanylate cyclase n=1 Tax=Erythrobacter crassostreae TaxID=2828328 RepID=A0A9X1F3T2_9SPHN|nr:sensor domain-containing diguanylate cyclase [Erythrobacter crassostrea]MBV7258305.1 diguanylate cyclase [Erythrobacter crassostrea]
MKIGLSDVEGRVLHGLVEECSGDVVVRLDANGFIVFASENVVHLGHDLSSMLVMPHISDLAEGEHGSALGAFVEQVTAGSTSQGWFEFPVVVADPAYEFGAIDCRRWYALSIRRIDDEHGQVQGALGLIRSVQYKRAVEGELHSRAVTDPLTGLLNRHAFCENLRRRLARGGTENVVIFAVDRMRSLIMQYGQRTADEIMWGFAKFIEAMALPGYEIAQFDNERLAVIVPEMTATSTRLWAEDVLKTFGELALPASSRSPKLTASAGLARLECTVDWTLRQAELALVMARAGGGRQVGECGYHGGVSYPGASNDSACIHNAVGVAVSSR